MIKINFCLFFIRKRERFDSIIDSIWKGAVKAAPRPKFQRHGETKMKTETDTTNEHNNRRIFDKIIL